MAALLAKFVAFTHSAGYGRFITHAPVAAALVLWQPHWWMFAFAASIGLWKNLVLDMKFQPGADKTDQTLAALWYLGGAVVGWLGAHT